MAGRALPSGRNSALGQVTPTSQCDLGPTLPIPNLSLPIGTRREVGWSLGPYSQRAALPWCLPRDHRVCLVQKRLLHQTGTPRGQTWAEPSLSPCCPQWPVRGSAGKGHRCLLMECPNEDSVGQVPESLPSPAPCVYCITHGNSILCSSRDRKTPSDACTAAQPGTQPPKRSLCCAQWRVLNTAKEEDIGAGISGKTLP